LLCIYVEREAEVFRYSLAFERLTALSLGLEDSAALLAELAGAMK
jgi:hypothetical protein